MSGASLFVGSLCRFFADDGLGAEARVAGVESWLADLGDALAGRQAGPTAWREDPTAASEEFGLGQFGLPGVRLLAVHAERPELELPDDVPEDLTLDRAWREATAHDFVPSHYGQLLAAELWLPGAFDYTFRCPRPDGDEATFGSLAALRDQLGFLAARTIAAGGADFDAWAHSDEREFLAAARRGIAAFSIATGAAIERNMPLVLRA